MRLGAGLGLEELQLARCLHTLGNGLHAQAGGHADDGAHNGFVVGVVGDVAHEGLVDLDLVDLKLLQITQGRIAGAEVVNRHAHTPLVQVVHDGNGAERVVHGDALGQLQLQLPGWQLSLLQNGGHQLRQIGMAKLHG